MTSLKEIEQNRLWLQAKLDNQKTMLERNKMGQYSTPPILAEQMIKHGLNLLGENKNVKFLDPAFGTGAFFSALLKTVKSRHLCSAVACEIDPDYGSAAKQLWSNKNIKIEIADFTRQLPRQSEKSNLIICNPPYVRHQHINPEEKKRLQRETFNSCGSKISGLAGLYCYFLGLTHIWLEQGAISGWLIPSEFMTVNYGREIKEYLLKRVTLLHIHRFDPKDTQFDDALVSSAVVWFKNERPNQNHEVKFSYGGSLDNPVQTRMIPREKLSSMDKWTNYPEENVRDKDDGPTLGDLFYIKRGIATGDNNFFIMSLDEIKKRNLPLECFLPVLPSSRYLKNDLIDADENGWPLIDRQLFVLDTDLPEHILKSTYPDLADYLETGRKRENPVTNRYICKHRKLWYSQETRPAAPILCTYMGRGSATSRPFRFILNYSKATACNVFLMLYPKPNLQSAIKEDPELIKRIWQDLNDIEPEVLLSYGRVYGGGLYKLEPKELRSIPVRNIYNLAELPKVKLEISLAS